MGMSKKILAAAVVAAFASSAANAAFIGSAGGNNTFDTAMAVPAGYFDLIEDGAIELSTTLPHATVVAFSSGPFDYFKFTMGAGQLILDIDYTYAYSGNPGSFDPEIALWKADGTLIAENDDRGFVDVGSTHSWDSYLNISHLDAGTYIVGVAQYPSSAINGGWASSANAIPADSFYTMHISAPVPEPESWAMMLAGLGIMAGVARRRVR